MKLGEGFCRNCGYCKPCPEEIDINNIFRFFHYYKSYDLKAYARQHYNDQVLKYNTAIETFPAVIIAGSLRFTEREYFEVDDESRGNVSVEF